MLLSFIRWKRKLKLRLSGRIPRNYEANLRGSFSNCEIKQVSLRNPKFASHYITLFKKRCSQLDQHQGTPFCCSRPFRSLLRVLGSSRKCRFCILKVEQRIRGKKVKTSKLEDHERRCQKTTAELEHSTRSQEKTAEKKSKTQPTRGSDENQLGKRKRRRVFSFYPLFSLLSSKLKNRNKQVLRENIESISARSRICSLKKYH